MTQTLPSRKVRRFAVTGALVLAAAVFGAAVLTHRANTNADTLPTAIQSVFPTEDSEVLRQTDITVDMAVGYTGELEVNGVPIPEEELYRVDALNQMTFRPGQGTSIERLLPDRNCIRVKYWLIAASSDAPTFYTWCFNAS